MNDTKRRDFLKKCGLSTLPFLLPSFGYAALPTQAPKEEKPAKGKKPVNFIYDGFAFSPQEYLQKLAEINSARPIAPDFYGNGGETALLEREFARITNKEKAIYLPTGTMANQLAIKLLNGHNTKVLVPENSHVYRDEADAAQSVHGKRLVPVGIGKPYFDLKELDAAIHYLNTNEVFKSGLGTVVIENPVRRADGAVVPLEIIKEVAAYCKQQGYKLHLDGARLHLASAFSGVSVAEYASYFDTVYISLYKYLNASGGAILCGEAALIDQVAHQIKIHGGTVFQSWQHTAMALHYLEGIEERWTLVRQSADKLVAGLNKLSGVFLKALANGSTIYHLRIDKSISLKTLANVLYNDYSILLGRADEKGNVKFSINESLLSRNTSEIIHAWQKAIEKARG